MRTGVICALGEDSMIDRQCEAGNAALVLLLVSYYIITKKRKTKRKRKTYLDLLG